jgi:hypothetical protein
MMELFPGTASLQTQSVKNLQLIPSVTTIKGKPVKAFLVLNSRHARIHYSP